MYKHWKPLETEGFGPVCRSVDLSTSITWFQIKVGDILRRNKKPLFLLLAWFSRKKRLNSECGGTPNALLPVLLGKHRHIVVNRHASSAALVLFSAEGSIVFFYARSACVFYIFLVVILWILLVASLTATQKFSKHLLRHGRCEVILTRKNIAITEDFRIAYLYMNKIIM